MVCIYTQDNIHHMFIKNRDPEVVRAQEEELRSTAILDSFVNNIETQMPKHQPFSHNTAAVEKLMSGFSRAIRAMKRLIDADILAKYEARDKEFRECWEIIKRDVHMVEEGR